MLDIDQLLADLNSPKAEVRKQARVILRRMAPLLLKELSQKPEAEEIEPRRFKIAQRLFTALAHDRVRPSANPKERQQAIIAFEKAALSPAYPRMLRSHFLYLLGCIGDLPCAKRLAVLEKDSLLGQDARMARERIGKVKI